MATSMTTNAVLFVDTFHGLNEDLDIEVKQWPFLNMFYLNFDEMKIDSNEALSTSQQQVKHQSSKVITTAAKKDIEQYFYDIPDYLSASNSDFLPTFFCELRNFPNPVDFQDIQELAVLTHQSFIIHSHQQLWHCFLQAGKGLLPQQRFIQDHTNFTATLSFWPQIVTSIMIDKGILPPNHINNDHSSNNRQEQSIYINFIQNYLQQLEEQAKQHKLKFQTILKRLPCHSHETTANKIERLVTSEESRSALQLHFQRRIALFEYVCTDRSYQLAYFQEKPTDIQLQIVKEVCSVTYEKEKARQEMYLYKFDFLYSRFPKSFDILQTSPPSLITTLTDSVTRKRLSDEYQRIITGAKASLLFIYTRASEARNEYHEKKFDQEMTKMWKNQHQQPAHERLTPTMLKIIEQRQKNIIECFKTIYRLKGDFYVKAPPRIFPSNH